MKKAIRFMEMAPFTIAFSLIIIIGGFTITAIRGGFNLGIDFVGGYNQQIQFAPVALTLNYTGPGQADTLIQNGVLTLSILETDRNESLSFNFKDYATVDLLNADLAQVNGISVTPVTGYNKGVTTRLMNMDFNVVLNAANPKLNINIKLENENEIFVTKEKITTALADFGRFTIQSMGDAIDQKFVIKINNVDALKVIAATSDAPAAAVPTAVPGDAAASDQAVATTGLSRSAQDQIETKIKESLAKVFEKDAMLFQKKDFIGATFSKEIATGAIWSVVLAILLILVYVSFRFKPEYAVASVLALVHDCSVMIVVIGAFQLEMNATAIAAILTILGYSINDTIVIFDRIRENYTLIRDMDRKQLINYSITQTLARTVITSITTFMTVISILLVSNGIIWEFAFSLLIGIIAGSYSTIFIASVIVLWWQNWADKRTKAKQEVKISGFKTGAQKVVTDATAVSEEKNSEQGAGDDEQLIQRKKKRKKKR